MTTQRLPLPPDLPPGERSVSGLRDDVPMTITAARLRRSRLTLADLIVELNMMINECEDLYPDAKAESPDALQLVRDLAGDLSATWVAGMRAYARLRSLTIHHPSDLDPEDEAEDRAERDDLRNAF